MADGTWTYYGLRDGSVYREKTGEAWESAFIAEDGTVTWRTIVPSSQDFDEMDEKLDPAEVEDRIAAAFA